MKKLILTTAVVVLFTACHSTTDSFVETSDSAVISSVKSVTVINDSLQSDSIKTIVDTLKK